MAAKCTRGLGPQPALSEAAATVSCPLRYVRVDFFERRVHFEAPPFVTYAQRTMRVAAKENGRRRQDV